MSKSYEKDSGNVSREIENQDRDGEKIAFSSGRETFTKIKNQGYENESKYVYREIILRELKIFWKKSKSTCTNELHLKFWPAKDMNVILSALMNNPLMINQFDDKGFLPSSIIAESNFNLSIEIAKSYILFSNHNNFYRFFLKNIFSSHIKFPSKEKKKEDLLKLAEAYEEKENHVLKIKILCCNLQFFCKDSNPEDDVNKNWKDKMNLFLEKNIGNIYNEKEFRNSLNSLMEETDDANQIYDIIHHLLSSLEEKNIMEKTYEKMLEDFLNSFSADDKINDFSDFLALQEEEEIENFLRNKLEENNSYIKELLINYHYWKDIMYERLHQTIKKLGNQNSIDALKMLEEKENAKCASIQNVIKKLNIVEDSLHNIAKEKISKEEKYLFLWCYLSRRYHLLKILFPSSRFDTNFLCAFCGHMMEKLSVSKLQDEVAEDAWKVNEYSFVSTPRAWFLENWLCGIDPLGKLSKNSLKKEDIDICYQEFISDLPSNKINKESIQETFNSLSKKNDEKIKNKNKIQDFFKLHVNEKNDIFWQNFLIHSSYLFSEYSKESDNFFQLVIDNIIKEDTQFLQFLIEYNLLKEVVYDNLFIILPALLQKNDTSYGAWPIECINYNKKKNYVSKCACINKVMKDLGYEYFSPLKEKINICEKEKDLLLWCCFSGRYKLVNFFLRNSQFDVIPLGVFCSHMIQKLLKNSHLTSESVESMKKISTYCQRVAKDALQATCQQCGNEKDKDSISDYLELKNPTFNNLSLFDMTVNSRCSQVLSLGPFKNCLSNRWYKAADVLHPFPRFILAVCSFEWLFPINIISWLICKPWLIKKEENNENFFKLCKNTCQTPYIKCMKYVVLHIAFLILLAYVVLSSFDAKPKDPCEIACCIYVLAYGMEEIKQVILEFMSKGFCLYIKNFWNICDVIAVVTFIVGFGCRLSLLYENNSTLHSISRLFYNVSILFFSVRLLFMCTLFDNMRSKLIILRKVVVKDVLPFLPILFLFSIPYGVAVQSMMLVNGTTYKVEEILYNAFGFGYFALVGEFHMDNFTWDEKEKIGSISAYIFLIIFALITNIVLLNLLIALFSKTAEAIDEEEAFLNVALLDRIEIVEEFENKSAFSPPFNILQIFFEGIRWLFCRSERDAFSRNIVGAAVENEEDFKCEWNFKIFQAAGLRGHRKNIGKFQDDQKIGSKTICQKINQKLNKNLCTLLDSQLKNRDEMAEKSLNKKVDVKLDKKDIKSICKKLNQKLLLNIDKKLNKNLNTLEAKFGNRDNKFEEKMKKMVEEMFHSQRDSNQL